MNIVILEEADFVSEWRVVLGERRALHIGRVLQAQVGDRLRVGRLNGDLGSGVVVELSSSRVELEVSLDRSPPSSLPVGLLLALPRPKVMKRVLAAAVTMGVKEIFLFNSWRVEKSYWQSPWLGAEKLREVSILALEQAGDTRLPEILLQPRFRPFVEDEVPLLAQDRDAWLLHPQTGTGLSEISGGKPALVAVGPEGGFIPFEVEMLVAAGFKLASLGPRILRVEQAVPAILGRFLL
ncbi:MAG: 16S rRNA (uracil(1498)-N(3))-methyltransferase [Deltaproteobacteria bacterium]|nr:16S rRNA (uracil(1498)-N(3))-methyltransferase [Candidatus Tharpella sp.]